MEEEVEGSRELLTELCFGGRCGDLIRAPLRTEVIEAVLEDGIDEKEVRPFMWVWELAVVAFVDGRYGSVFAIFEEN